MKALKTAYVMGGSSHAQRFFLNKNEKYKDFFDEKIYLLDLEKTDISSFDLLVISSRLNTRFLKKNEDKIRDFLSSGKSVVFFGEHDESWFSEIKYKSLPTNFWWWINKGADLPVYVVDDEFKKYLSDDDCKWHYHGIFHTKTEHKKVIVNELNEAIFYEDSSTFKGKMFVTTLDPEFHFGMGFMPKTEPFFDKFMEYVLNNLAI